jgi:outer membrane protein
MRKDLILFFSILCFALPSKAIPDEDCSSAIVLSLEKALSLVINQNRSLVNAQDHVTNAEYQVSIAAADFDLQIRPRGDVGYVGGGTLGSGATMGTGIDISKKIPFGTKFVINPFVMRVNDKYRTHVNVTVSQPLLRGFGKDYTLSSLRGAEFSYRSTSRAFFTTQNQLILRTISALYEVLKAQKSLVVNTESHLRVEKFFQTAALKAKIGLSDTLDVYRAEVEMGLAEDTLRASKEKLQETEDILRDILALPSDIVIQVELPLVYHPLTLDLEEALDIALSHRVEVDQAEDHFEENQRLSCIAKKRLMPELNVVLNYSNLGEDQYFTDSIWGKRDNTWGVGLTTSTDFNPFADKAAYEMSLLAVGSASRGMEQAVSNVTFEVKRSMRNLQRAKEKMELQKKQIHSSKGGLRLAELKFDRGMANNFDLIQAEKTLKSAELSYWHALIDHIVGEYQLQSHLGILMDKPCF